jgi:SRSO17 transposase
VTTGDDLAVAAGHSVDGARWLGLLDELMLEAGRHFRRPEPRRRARAFVLGLLAPLPRKNCWTIAEQAGDATPDGMQNLLARACWDADGVRDEVRRFAVGHLGDHEAVLVADETGDLKKGTATAGVQRQYTGTAGRIENAQVAVYLGYASPAGYTLIDRELYLPQSWTADTARCAAAGIPPGTVFATKPELAWRMVERACDAGAPFGWFTGDEVYGGNGKLRGSWKAPRSATCWRCPATITCPLPPGTPSALMTSPPGCPAGPGSGCRPAGAQRDSATTTGPG